mgnify:CR=1 FL=1
MDREELTRLLADTVEAVFVFLHQRYAFFSSVFREHGLNYHQYGALMLVYLEGRISEGELSRLLFLNPSTVSRMVYALEKEGWVRCRREDGDRRKVWVSLTPTGKRRLEAIKRKQAEYLAEQVDALGPEERERVYRLAEAVNRDLRMLISLYEENPVRGER